MNSNWTSVILFGAFVACRFYLQPTYSLISDCDETFNYWEPLNFLLRGFGKQTWEYSPEYSIRSWAFLIPLYSVLNPSMRILEAFHLPMFNLFYIARFFLGLFSLVMEWLFFEEIKSTLSTQTATFWLFFQVFNPGWFHASVELLPSSFAMISLLGSLKFTLRYLSTGAQDAFVKALLFNFVGGILGWPFVMILSVPLVVHYIFSHRILNTLKAGISAASRLAVVTAVVFAVDSMFYGKFTPVAWNIVMYNVIGANEKSGPNIFGVEPWYYYIFSLLLNIPLPVLLGSIVGLSNLRLWPVWGALATWLTVFLLQPHKEERFLYPIYGFVTLASSVGFSSFWRKWSGSKLTRNTVFLILLCSTASQALLRMFALVQNYKAPLDVYSHLPEASGPQTVCVGREWFHFPASMFLPDNYRLGFVPSGFDGLLPGDFKETDSILNSIRDKPVGMNNQNLFDSSKLVVTEQCDYFVDFMLHSDNEKDAFDPTNLPQGWKKLYSALFVDAPESKFFGRALLLPEGLTRLIPQQLQSRWSKIYQVKYLEYCIFERHREEV
ncbi:dolichyl-P-Man:Man(6)GlcNAc(2)-PP-dolichol alpha-1,2-mannosyltransferase [Lachancea thermotolerans CBS 6340]|uniref:Mannosyltransferase n=1 Tax=Lachancea thermotolerans (strain ATCC 56472 / CBS 6340 / NRRL Y-8284) TaxID=559295 RepID=C5DD41_LACTC|nr:KLTH0B08096p [Lachancea thermotolerans CBS 6340]CAR21702.1 KLTH0B08096p [Lachancea thermotolerans CBS 6340]